MPFNNFLSNLTNKSNGLTGQVQDIAKKATELISNPSLSRLNINNLLPGGKRKPTGGVTDVFFGSFQGSTLSPENDWRVKVTAPPAGPFDFSQGPLSALAESSGVVFPFTPEISITHSASYGKLTPTHSNYPSYFFSNSEIGTINITADFTAQTEDQARYVLGMIWFFRSATKMFYGGPNAGNPPPIVYIDGYGDYYLPHVSCVVNNFTHSMPSNIDYIECTVQPGLATNTLVSGDILPQNLQAVQTGLGTSTSSITNQLGALLQSPGETRQVRSTGKRARIPTKSSITVSLQPVYSRNNISNKFTWEDFSKGALLKGNGGFL